MAQQEVTLLLLSGSMRAESTNAALLRTASSHCPERVRADLFTGLDTLPHFNPDDDVDDGLIHPAVANLRAAIAAADACLICTPEYAGALPGTFKNLLEWTIGSGSFLDKPTAWVNVSSSLTGAADAHESLRKVLGYAGADIVESACRHVPVERSVVGIDGLIDHPDIQRQTQDVVRTLAAHCRSGQPATDTAG